MIAALLLDPLALWHAERPVSRGVPVVVTEAGRVLHANAAALTGGVAPGMRVSGALSRLPELHAAPHSPPALAQAWAEVLAELPAYSPRLEVLAPGRALLTLSPGAGADLAAALGARVGLGGSREVALLAAHAAAPGTARVVAAAEETAFRAALPLDALCGLGLSAGLRGRLGWLGLGTVGELLGWSRAQQSAFLGPEYAPLRPYLHGSGAQPVAPARVPETVRGRAAYDAPLCEPGELMAAARDLAARALPALAGRRPGRVAVRAEVAGLVFTATRLVKEDLRAELPLARALLRALDDARPRGDGGHGLRLEVDALELVLGDLERPATQPDLWGRARAREAAGLVDARYPGALRRVEWLDPHALAPDLAYRWVGALSAEPGPVADTPRRRVPVGA